VVGFIQFKQVEEETGHQLALPVKSTVLEMDTALLSIE
jgi:hypothetical protein